MIVRHPRGGRAIHMMHLTSQVASWAEAWPELPPSCVPDTSNPNALAIATSIATSNTPAPWINRNEYAALIDGLYYLFCMWSDGIRKNVSIYRCDPPKETAARVSGLVGTPYSATVECPCAPVPEGWKLVNAAMQEAQDQTFLARASEVVGDLPAWTFADEWLGRGLYRWFVFENACGKSCGAMKYVGQMGDVAPQEQDPGTVDPISPDNPKGAGGMPLPQPDATCDAWEPAQEGTIKWQANGTTPALDLSSPIGIANSISYHNAPVPWKDQTFYRKTMPNGERWTFVMYSAGAVRMVSTFKCTAPKKAAPPSLTVSSSALWVVLALVLAVAVGGGVAYASQKKHDRKAA
jgi:hypothetical protein